MINNKAYLNRIHFQGNPTPTLQTLQSLQKQHLLHIPFENWLIHDHVAIKLETDYLFNKIIEQQRGGFCYELNGLFYVLLSELGFVAHWVSARVYSSSTDSFGAEFDHLAIVVTLDRQDYLLDVGFGEFAEMCHSHQTSPQSHFTQKRLLSLATENGRITLSDNELTVREGNQITETVLSDDVDSIIERYFSPFPTTQQ